MKNADLIKLKYPTRNVFSHLQDSTMSLFKFVLEKITIATLSNILIRMKQRKSDYFFWLKFLLLSFRMKPVDRNAAL